MALISLGLVVALSSATAGAQDETPLAPTPTVTATPDADLVDRQEVLLQGTGFEPNTSVYALQCRAGELDTCPRWAGDVRVGPDGSFTLPTTISRRLNIDDCVDVGCVIKVTSDSGETFIVPLFFDPSIAPPPVPEMSVTPSTGLVDRQTVNVIVTGLNPGDFVSLTYCEVDGACYRMPDGRVDTDSWSVDLVLVRRIHASDCAIDSCELRVGVSGRDSFLSLGVPVAFDPDSPLEAPPQSRLLPASGLWDGQRIELIGTRFVPGDNVEVRQCVGESTAEEDCLYVTHALTDHLGDLSIRVPVSASLQLTDRTVDCRTERCSLDLRSQVEIGPLLLQFDQSDGRRVFPTQLECVAWPTDSWPEGDVPAGVDPDELQQVIDDALAGGTKSMVVIHGGQLVAEGYDPGVEPTTLHLAYSVGKTFVGTLVGMLVDDGLLDIDLPAPVPEWSDPEDPRHQITTRHLLHMSSGLEWNENYNYTFDNDIIQMLFSSDSTAYVANKPLLHEPGTVFSYSTGTTQILSRIVANTLGVAGDELQATLKARLFGVLGQAPDPFLMDDTGVWRSNHLLLSTRDLARFGLLHVRGGVWEDTQLVSQAWIEFMGSPAPTSAGYGGQLWLRGGGRTLAIGLDGQGIYMAPDLDLVIAVNSETGSGGGNWRGVAALFEAAAAPRCGNGPVAVDDRVSVATNSSATIDVLANDSGAEADIRPDTLTIAIDPASGTATVTDGQILYGPDESFTGTDTFTYLVCTTAPSCYRATVTVTITAAPTTTTTTTPATTTTTTTPATTSTAPTTTSTIAQVQGTQQLAITGPADAVLPLVLGLVLLNLGYLTLSVTWTHRSGRARP